MTTPYEFTFTLVDGKPRLDRRPDLPDIINIQAEGMLGTVIAGYTTNIVAGPIRIRYREDLETFLI
jgi:hypothetical protein